MRSRFKRASKEDRLLLIGLPIFVAVLLAGWGIWASTAQFDDVEARMLTWTNIADRAVEHMKLVLVCTVLVVGMAVPVGVLLTRQPVRFLQPVIVGIANAGQAAPIIGVIVLLALLIAFGFWTAVLALTIYAFLPVLANTIAGLRSVDPALVEAGRGMGMSPVQTLFRIELPIAVPVILTGIRTALVLLVGAGAFAAFIDAGGLGVLIQTGIVLFRYSILVSGALLVAALALAVEWFGRLFEVLLRPGGLT